MNALSREKHIKAMFRAINDAVERKDPYKAHFAGGYYTAIHNEQPIPKEGHTVMLKLFEAVESYCRLQKESKVAKEMLKFIVKEAEEIVHILEEEEK